MGFFGKLIKTAITAVETPIAIIKDAATLGGTINDNDETYTEKKLKELGDDYQKMKDSLDE